MPITQEMYLELEKGIQVVWDKEMKTKKDYRTDVFNIESSTKAEERHMGIGSMGQMSEWAGTVAYSDFVQGYSKAYRHAKYSNGLSFERELFDDEEYREIRSRVRKLSDTVYKTQQAHGVAPFNNAFNASFAGPDAVALCSASHPLGKENATLQSNVGSLSLTMANLQTAWKAMSQFKDDQGELLGAIPDMLYVGPEYWAEAKKICGTAQEPFSAENDINVFSGELTYKFNPRIVGKKWFLIDSGLMKTNLNWYNRRTPSPEREDVFDSELIKFKVVGRWSQGFDDYSWIWGSSN